MTRFLLLLLFASTASAAPPASPGLPRPTGPRGDSFLAGLAEPTKVAKPVRPKFELDPKAAFPDTLDVVYLANSRPVRVRVTLTANGKPLGELWRAHLKKLFDAFDRDRDGSLNRFEVDNIFSPKGLSGLLGGSYYHGAGDDGKTLADLDRDGDGRVSFAEFAVSYDEAAADLVRLRSVTLDDTFDRELTAELFARLDTNGDKKLSKDELANAESLLHSLDTDENEALSAFEIRRTPMVRAGATPAVMSTERPPPAKPDTSLRLYRAGVAIDGAALVKRYDANKDGRVVKAEIALDAPAFAKLDANGDGHLTDAELDGWKNLEPDFTAAVNLAHDTAKRLAVLTPRGGKLPADCELRTGEAGRVVLRIGNQLLDLSTAAPPPGGVARRVTDQLNSAFPQDQKFVTDSSLAGPQFQFLRVVFESADANGDGKLTREEFKKYLELQEETINLALTASFGTRRPSLFQLMDDNGDNQLGIRELRTAFQRLIVLEPTGSDTVTQAALQPSASVRFGFAAFLGSDYNMPVNPFARTGARKVSGPLWFRKMDRNGDNDVSRAEFIGPREKFDELDADGDGLISAAEADTADKKLRKK